MKNDSDINKLDHVILSKNGNFLVYYMTSGRSAIKDKDASKIADVLENSVVNYKTKFNLDYKYSIQYDHFSENTFIKCPVGTSKSKACSLLKENNIDVLICGGLGYGAVSKLNELNIKLYAGVSGSCDEAIKAYLNNSLNYDNSHTCEDEHLHTCHSDVKPLI